MKTAVFVALMVRVAYAQELAIDDIMKEWTKPGSPGASVAVIRGGNLVFAKGYGLANIEHGIPNRTNTVFELASTSKQFTATALVILEQRGKLSLEDDVHKYVPELPDYGHPMTIRDLLQHTSGIRDYMDILPIAGWRFDDFMTQSEILRILSRQTQLQFVPGTQHRYSNSGYAIAAEIVSRVSGKPIGKFCEEAIFTPLGMKATQFPEDHAAVVPNRATAYKLKRDAGKWTSPPPAYAHAGAIGLLTTATDLALWIENFRNPKVGDPAMLQKPGVLSDGKTFPYGLGLALFTYRGLRGIAHCGSNPGYKSCMEVFLDQDLGVVVLSNTEPFDPSEIADRIAAVFIGDKMTPERTPAAAAQLQEPDYMRSVQRGWQHDTQMKSSRANSGILAAPQRTLPDYAGDYWSSELETQYKVTVKDDRLQLAHIRLGELWYDFVGLDRFWAKKGVWNPMPTIDFTRDSTGKVNGFVTVGQRFTRR